MADQATGAAVGTPHFTLRLVTPVGSGVSCLILACRRRISSSGPAAIRNLSSLKAANGMGSPF